MDTQKALVVGGNGTLGSAFVKSLLEREWSVASTHHEKPQTEVPSFFLDLHSPDSMAQNLQLILEKFGLPDLLLIASGTACYNPLSLTSDEDLSHTLRVDLQAPIELVKFFLPLFQKRNSGTLHIVSAIAGVLPAVKNMSVYTAAKFGLVGFARSLAWELLGSGVKISVSCPGGIRSELPNHALGDKESLRKFFDQYAKNFDSPESISEAILEKISSREIVLFPTEGAKKLFEQSFQKPYWV